MLGTMAKKKPTTPAPAPGSEKKDQHKSGSMVRLPNATHAAMMEQAAEEDRPLARIIKQLCHDYLRSKGKTPPAEEKSARRKKKGGAT